MKAFRSDWVQRVKSAGAKLARSLSLTKGAEFETIFKLSPVGIAEVELSSGRLIRVNDRYCELTGYTREELLITSVQSLTHPDDRKTDWEKFQRLCRGEIPEYDNEKRYVRKDGGVIWVRVTARTVHDKRGAFPRSIGIVQDITYRKRYEQMLRDARDTAEQNRAQQEAILQSITEGLVICDPSGTLVHMNPAALGIYGCALDDMRGRGIEYLDSVLEIRDGNEVVLPVSHWPISRALHGETFRHFEVHVRRKDGSKEWFASYGGSPVCDRDGRLLFAIVTMRDISERRKAEAEIAAAKAEAERANEAKDEFLAVLSHELRTPLAPVLAAAQLLQRRQDLSATVLMYLDIMRRNIGMEARLIDDLLDLTRIARGKIALTREQTSIPDIIEKVVDVCRPEIDVKNLHLEVDAPIGEPWVDADPSRLQQILWNVIKNAIKFTPHGGAISVRARGEDEMAVVEVQDTGIGIEQESLTRIFGAFEQGDVKVTRKYGGLGLGLAITKQLVEMHGGTISAASEGTGKGATFTVTLPRVRHAEAEGQAAQVPGHSTTRHHARILLVEDHPDTARIMLDVFRSSGFDVETAPDATHALAAAEARNFDLLVSDLGLPDRSGFELMDELRRHGNRVKGIALSGFGRDEDVEKSKAAGFAEHLTKPVDMDALVAAVERVAAS